jgi:hypothetical protein
MQTADIYLQSSGFAVDNIHIGSNRGNHGIHSGKILLGVWLRVLKITNHELHIMHYILKTWPFINQIKKD